MFFFQLPSLPEWWVSRDDYAALDRMMRSTARPGTFKPEDVAVFKSALREPGALTAGINYYRANLRALLRRAFERREFPAAEKIRVPALFIYGERDFAIVPETVRGVADYVNAPYTELRLARSGHWVQQEFHAEVSAAAEANGVRDGLEAALAP